MADFPNRVRAALSRAAAREQVRRDSPPHSTQEDLVRWARQHLAGTKLVVVSNREPYSHLRTGEGVRWVRNPGGLTVALDSIASALGGVWVAHGSGSADRLRSDESGRTPVPPERPRYTLRRLWLSREDQQLYYSGFSNGALWPLCHIVFVRPRFRREEWERYLEVNARFAEAVLDEVGSGPALILLQDYHLACCARFIKERRPELPCILFWHIPWPNSEVFRRLPWREEILAGMLANDLLGFHVRYHANNFLDTVADVLEARVDRERMAVERIGHRTWVREFPIGVDPAEIAALADSATTHAAIRRLREEHALGEARIGVGVDRLDYTKGIPERLDAVERLLERHSRWRGRFTFIQVGVPSRVELPEYRELVQRVESKVARLNRLFTRGDRKAVVLLMGNHDFRDIVPLYRMADLCAVTSLHDGMNLVAKEYVAAKTDLEGALVLSPFTGASRELERAIVVTPFDVDALAEAYHQALTLPAAERRARMGALRDAVFRSNIFDWALGLMDASQRLMLRPSEAEGAPATSH
jgi:trehalose 6-phosphate synthase